MGGTKLGLKRGQDPFWGLRQERRASGLELGLDGWHQIGIAPNWDSNWDYGWHQIGIRSTTVSVVTDGGDRRATMGTMVSSDVVRIGRIIRAGGEFWYLQAVA